MLAGVSSDYYVRLEQGRERHPSVQVVDALSRALHLDGDATDHLQRLARPVAGRRRLWARHEIRQKTRETKRFRHPLVGALTLDYESLTVNGAPGRQLVVYQAAPGSPSEQALVLELLTK